METECQVFPPKKHISIKFFKEKNTKKTNFFGIVLEIYLFPTSVVINDFS